VADSFWTGGAKPVFAFIKESVGMLLRNIGVFSASALYGPSLTGNSLKRSHTRKKEKGGEPAC
jgi:hypothetical protein